MDPRTASLSSSNFISSNSSATATTTTTTDPNSSIPLSQSPSKWLLGARQLVEAMSP